MLDYIRSNTQSFGVKLAFGLIILVFVFWGVGSFTERDSGRVMAKVNGEPILETQFYRHFQRVENQLMNQGVSRDQMRAEHLGRQVLESMIAHTLVRQEAARIGLDVTPLELRRAIQRNPLFLNDKGQLDKASYERGLNALRTSAADFEDEMRNELVYEKMFELVSGEVWLAPYAARSRYDFLFEKRALSYIFLPAKDFVGEVKISDEDRQKYYAAHKKDFTTPKKAKLTYVSLDPATLVDVKTITDVEAKKWYDAHQKNYFQAEAVRCAHILVPLAADADAKAKEEANATIAKIQKGLAEGKTFAELANTYNPPNAAGKDGELGWIERGKTVQPFEDAAFSQPVGQVSPKPIESQFGLHLILVEEKRPEKTLAFEEVKPELLKTMAADLGRDKVTEVGETLLEDNLLGKDLSKAAQPFNLKAQTTEFLDANELKTKLNLSQTDVNSILDGTPIDALLQAGDKVLVVRVDELKPETLEPIESVNDKIVASLKEDKALEIAKSKLGEILPKLTDGALNPETIKQYKIENTKPVDRMQAFEPFKADTQLTKSVFTAKLHTWIKTPFAISKDDGTKGAILAYVAEIKPTEDVDWERVQTIMENGLARETADNVRRIFLNELFRKAKITDVDMEKADRLGI